MLGLFICRGCKIVLLCSDLQLKLALFLSDIILMVVVYMVV